MKATILIYRNFKSLLTFAFLMLTLSLVQNALFAQNQSAVKGKVKNENGEALSYVSVLVKDTPQGTVTDTDGFFQISNLKKGSYRLVFSHVGYITQEIDIQLYEQQILTISEVVLINNEDNLLEFTVSDNRINPFDGKESEYAARMPLDNLENPQVYNVVTKELMKDQLIVGFDDALKNAPGVHKLWSSTGRGGDGAGYYSMRGFSVQPRLMNGIAGISNGSPDPANLEAIETIKGPSGTLFGGSLVSFGGLINVVTKKPFEDFGGEASITTGSYGLSRITADVNTPIDQKGKAHFRVNTAYHQEKSFQDAGFRKSFFVAPSLSYQVNDRLSFNINTEIFDSESTNPLMLFLNRSRELLVRTPKDLGVGYNRSFTSDDITIKTPTVNIYGQANYKISNKWLSQTNVSRSVRQANGYYQYVMFIQPGDSLLNRYISLQNSTNIVTDIQQNFIGDFKISGMRNRLVAGIDIFHNQTFNNNSAYILFDTVSTARIDPRYTQLTRTAVDARLAQNPNPAKNETNIYTYSAYFSDVLNITERLMTMFSLRIDRFVSEGTYNQITDITSGAYNQTALSPKLGAVYQILNKKASLFGNYMNGFQNVAPTTQPDGTIDVFDPQHANQWEVGLKTELFDGRVTGNISYYDIYVKNVTRPDPDRVGFTVQDGNISSKGIEAELIANPISGLNIIAGYGYNQSKNDRTAENINGRRPVAAGPEHLANFWISYRFDHSKLKGFGLGTGANFASENLITNSSATGTFALPAYKVLGATLFYDSHAYRLGLKVDNLTNQEYWGGWTTVEPQMPRRLLATLAMKF
ncbi:TonB-dependent receptor [Arthrospiribacter ruber]|uniref:TonB-dependent siderophore receptor n=1 Tax=Arthrospiribacter ruber TaxID=2487934 RepID=A0A951MB34_9BACT|nr:TonB-dependent receptor [Arthrospiribacter ruber]MBW3466974.1 TonB-dependent siderophore receptor [Arthrospiribacter ruber]